MPGHQQTTNTTNTEQNNNSNPQAESRQLILYRPPAAYQNINGLNSTRPITPVFNQELIYDTTNINDYFHNMTHIFIYFYLAYNIHTLMTNLMLINQQTTSNSNTGQNNNNNSQAESRQLALYRPPATHQDNIRLAPMRPINLGFNPELIFDTTNIYNQLSEQYLESLNNLIMPMPIIITSIDTFTEELSRTISFYFLNQEPFIMDMDDSSDTTIEPPEVGANSDKLEQLGFEQINVPIDLCCHISQLIMTDPVYDPRAPQIKFERAQIFKWLEIKDTHPETRQFLEPSDLMDDSATKQLCDLFVTKVEQRCKIQTKETNKREQLFNLYRSNTWQAEGKSLELVPYTYKPTIHP